MPGVVTVICEIFAIISRLSGIVLKKGISAGMTPFQISQLYVREELTNEKPSTIEKIVQQCVIKMSLQFRPNEPAEKRSEITRSLSTCNIKRSSVDLRRNLSTHSLSSIEYSKEPYSFPPV